MDDKRKEAAETEIAKIDLMRHIVDVGDTPTAQDVISFGMVTNADDAVALVSRLVTGGNAKWTDQYDDQAVLKRTIQADHLYLQETQLQPERRIRGQSKSTPRNHTGFAAAS